MKTTLLFLIPLFLCSREGFAQRPDSLKTNSHPEKLPSLDVYGTIPVKQCGGGVGFNLLSSPINIVRLDMKNSIQMRVGGEFYWAELDHRKMGNIPLAAPQTGNAKVRLADNVLGLNAMARFSLPLSQPFTPYVDVFGGYRGFTTMMQITPDHYQPGYQQNSSQSLSNVSQLNYGVTGGVLVSLGQYVKLNAGLMFTHSETVSSITDIRSVEITKDGLDTRQTLTPQNLLIAKVGLTILLERSNGNSNCNCNCRGRSGVYMGGVFRGGGGAGSHININVRPTR